MPSSISVRHGAGQFGSDRVTILFGHFEPGVGDRIHAGSNGVMDERVCLALVFLRQVVVDVQPLHRAADARGKSARIEIINDVNARDAVTDVLPGIIQPAPYR